MYDHDYYRRVCEKSRIAASARNQSGLLRSAYEDYHDPSMEMARILMKSAFTKEFVYGNLKAVYEEYVLTLCDMRHDPKRCQEDTMKHIDRDFRKYCEYVRMNGLPDQVKEVKYPV